MRCDVCPFPAFVRLSPSAQRPCSNCPAPSPRPPSQCSDPGNERQSSVEGPSAKCRAPRRLQNSKATRWRTRDVSPGRGRQKKKVGLVGAPAFVGITTGSRLAGGALWGPVPTVCHTLFSPLACRCVARPAVPLHPVFPANDFPPSHPPVFSPTPVFPSTISRFSRFPRLH